MQKSPEGFLCEWIVWIRENTCRPLIHTFTNYKEDPLTLRKLSLKAILSKSYTKSARSASYVSDIFPNELENWMRKCPFQNPVKVEGLEDVIPYWYAHSERRENGHLLTKRTDCSHNLTHLRIRACTKGIRGVSSIAWRKCAKYRETFLSLPIVEDIIDKQRSQVHVRTSRTR
jgi:hypothetical protein